MIRDMRAITAACVAVALVLTKAQAQATGGVPRFDHVVVVIEENHAYSQIIGSPAASYINSLAAGGALMTQSHALTHPSQPNYIALFSGSTQGVTTDSVYPHSQFTAPNLGSKLLSAGFTFSGFSETMPSVGFDGASAGTAPAEYRRKHNPWVNWQDAGVPLPANKLPPAVNLPYAGYFPAATAYDTLPTLSIVVPNQL
ncbi:MAG TPA: alkaline phosphatase family protein, partial [Burkholderiaceae bacterium]|nr:alkaline phosphatase family protein [Burkholderiaceae bacterium]